MNVTVRILGARPFVEELRFGLCHADGVTTLAVQMASSLQIGLPVGNILTETLHIFSQPERCAVRLRSLGYVRSCSQQEQALSGMKKGREKYLEKAFEALRSAPAQLLRQEPEPVRQPGNDDAGADDRLCTASPRPSRKGRRPPVTILAWLSPIGSCCQRSPVWAR